MEEVLAEPPQIGHPILKQRIRLILQNLKWGDLSGGDVEQMYNYTKCSALRNRSFLLRETLNDAAWVSMPRMAD